MIKSPRRRSMQKSFLTCCVVFTVLFSAVAIGAEKYTFRKTRWGMSQEQIMDSEESKLYLRGERNLVYNAKVLEKEMIIDYFLIDDKLIRAGYTLAENHIADNQYIGDFGEIKEVLNRKYGDPIEDRTIWKNDYFKSNLRQWGTAVSVGHLSFFSAWETDSTVITASLTGGQFKFSCIVVYKSKKLIHLEKKAGNVGKPGTGDELSGNKSEERNEKMQEAMEDF